ncbi:MAG: thymidine phosphorylase [Ardenticatenales bacterium]
MTQRDAAPPLNPSLLELIEAKRDGRSHHEAQLRWLMRAVVGGAVPDYQLAAWLMAVVLRGMTGPETAALTRAMAESGACLDLSDVPGPTVDKHSTGGVGDKTTLVVGPLAAATGLTMAKMSGRGLGHTGGTLDKLESFPGLTVDLDVERFKRQARDVRLVIAGQTADLAPADRILYALRDVTGTVPSLPLIASSIMSKKLAAGASAIVLDVKVGGGAFMKTLPEARALAEAMLSIGRAAAPPRRMAALLTAMDQPLGRAIGNALEVAEAIATLRGDGPADLLDLSLQLTALLHVAAGIADHVDAVRPALERAIASGAALDRLRQLVEAQGGDPRCVDDPALLPHAPHVATIRAARSGVVLRVDARALGDAAVRLGAGRRRKGEAIDHAVGLIVHARCGDSVAVGDALADVHARTSAKAADVETAVRAAFAFDVDGVEDGGEDGTRRVGRGAADAVVLATILP